MHYMEKVKGGLSKIFSRCGSVALRQLNPINKKGS